MEWIFRKNFGKHAVSTEPENNLEYLTEDEVFKYLEKNPHTRSISSHQIEVMFPQHEKYRFFTCLFTRHPIDRVFSIYFFKKNQNDDSIGTMKANQLDLEKFIRWNLDTNGYRVMKNFQTLYVTNNHFRHDANRDDLGKAKEILRKIDVLGTVDRIDESLVVAEETLRPFYNKIDLAYVKQNISKERDNDLSKRVEKESKIIVLEMLEKLKEHNKLDLELFDECNQELDKRMQKIENFEDRLDQFKIRCHELDKKKDRIFLKWKKILHKA